MRRRYIINIRLSVIIKFTKFMVLSEIPHLIKANHHRKWTKSRKNVFLKLSDDQISVMENAEIYTERKNSKFDIIIEERDFKDMLILFKIKEPSLHIKYM